jgi:hypothetical protein
MTLTLPRRRLASVIALAALALALVGAATAGAKQHASQTKRLVVRGTDTVVEHPCPGGICFDLTGGKFRGTTGAGDYTGSLKLDLANAFPNGEGGVCAPVAGTITLGAGTKDRLDLAIWGDSCQVGAGDPTQSSFTGLARFAVVHGTGAYANARGGGTLVSLEGADDREQMTLIGRIR